MAKNKYKYMIEIAKCMKCTFRDMAINELSILDLMVIGL